MTTPVPAAHNPELARTLVPAGWWRRNRIALLLLIVLIPLAVVPVMISGSYGGNPLFSRNSTVALGSSTAISGSTLSIGNVVRVSGSAPVAKQVGIHPGTDLIIVRVKVSKHGAGGWCTTQLIWPDGRRSSPAGTGRVKPIPDGAGSWCSLDSKFDQDFLVPSGAPDPVSLSLSQVIGQHGNVVFRLPAVKRIS